MFFKHLERENLVSISLKALTFKLRDLENKLLLLFKFKNKAFKKNLFF